MAWALVFGALLCGVAWWMLGVRTHMLHPAAGVTHRPRLDPEVSNVRSDMFTGPGAGELLNMRQLNELEHYGWVDRQRGVVRIPIDVAIALELQTKTAVR